jgi:hypothetical protein
MLLGGCNPATARSQGPAPASAPVSASASQRIIEIKT